MADDIHTDARPPLTINENGILSRDGMAVGVCHDSTITLNLGWCRLAGLNVRVEDDPAVDNHRGGLVLDRPAKA